MMAIIQILTMLLLRFDKELFVVVFDTILRFYQRRFNQAKKFSAMHSCQWTYQLAIVDEMNGDSSVHFCLRTTR